MRNRTKLALLIFLSFLGLIAGSFVDAYSGGWRDDNQHYNCGGTSCHSGDANQGAGKIEVSLDSTSVLSGQSLSLTVNVTLVQLGGESIIGVFLLSSQTGSDDIPTDHGWKITQDPNGGTGSSAKNYVQKQSPGPGETVTFRWSLEAPPTPGTYSLYVRVHHGSIARNALWEDYESPIVVDVSPMPVGMPKITHTAVGTGYVDEPIFLRADVVNATKVFVHWRIAGEAQFNSLEMTNTSEKSDHGWVFEASIPSQGVEGEIEYQITASRETSEGPLVSDTSLFTVNIVKKPETPNMTAWLIQIIVISEVIVFLGIIGVRIAKSRTESEEDQDV